MRTEEARSPSSELRCVLCKKAEETEITGALNCKQGTAAHQNCLLYASGIYCKNSPTYDDLFGFDVEDVEEEKQRGRKLKCHYCNENGATAGCEVKSCRRSYHYPCAHAARARSVDSTFRLYCPKHDPVRSAVGATPSTSDRKLSVKKEQKNSLEGSKIDLETPGRSQNKKRRHLQFYSDSDETQSNIDLEMAPIESEFEDSAPPEKSARSDTESKSQDYKEQREDVDLAAAADDDEVCSDLDAESQSLLKAVDHQEDVPFTVIADSDTSSDPMSSTAPSPADLHSNIAFPPNPHPSLNSPASGTIDESCGAKADLPVKPERCASRDLPPLQMSFQNGRQGRVDTADPAAALFWRKCNEVGCTETIFVELARQLSDLAEKVTGQNATQQDYDVALGILKASGRLPAIINRMEKDMEHQEKQLQRKRKALSDAKAVFFDKQFI